MTELTVATPRLRTFLLPLLLAACTGKEGVLTDANASTTGPDTDSAGTTTAAATDVETGPLITSDEPATGGTTEGPHPNTSNATDTTTAPFPETTDVTTIDSDLTGAPETTEMGSTGSDTTTGALFGSEAALYNDCAPNDGPAFRIEIGLTAAACDAEFATTDKLRILIYKMAPVTGQFDLVFPNPGDAILDTGDGTPNFATSGTLTIDAWSDDEVTGSYDLTLDDNTHLSGSFAGPYCGGPFLCG